MSKRSTTEKKYRKVVVGKPKATKEKAVKKPTKKKLVEKKSAGIKPPKKTVVKEKATAKKKSKLPKTPSNNLLDAVIKGIQEKKGEKVVCLDLRKVNGSICDYFVVCQANSKTQVDSIARSVEDIVKQLTKERPYHSEG